MVLPVSFSLLLPSSESGLSLEKVVVGPVVRTLRELASHPGLGGRDPVVALSTCSKKDDPNPNLFSDVSRSMRRSG